MTKSMSSSATQAYLDQVRQKCSAIKREFTEKNGQLLTWMTDHQITFDDLKQLSQQLLAATSLAGMVAMQAPNLVAVSVPIIQAREAPTEAALETMSQEEYQEIFQKLESIVQMPPGHMEHETELYLEQQLSQILGFEVTTELEGHRLNHSIGIIGGEQHLRRFPNDTLAQHDAYQESGIAPNRGAFGWFTEDGRLTDRATQREKYYFAVQTLYLPRWNQEYQSLKPWYKFRKMIVVNPVERLAVVGVVGDAGPAQWVQKQFGGSPEVIKEGKLWSPKARGRVLLLFVDDPEDKVPLGLIHLDQLQMTF